MKFWSVREAIDLFLYSHKYSGPTVHIDMFNKTMFKGPVFELPEGMAPKHFSDALRTVSNGFRTSEQDGLMALDQFCLSGEQRSRMEAVARSVAKFMNAYKADWVRIDDFDCLESKSKPDTWYLLTENCIYYPSFRSSEMNVRLLRHMILLGLLGRYYQCRWMRRSVGILSLSGRWQNLSSQDRNVYQGCVLKLPLANIPAGVIDGMQDWLKQSEYKLRVK